MRGARASCNESATTDHCVLRVLGGARDQQTRGGAAVVSLSQLSSLAETKERKGEERRGADGERADVPSIHLYAQMASDSRPYCPLICACCGLLASHYGASPPLHELTRLPGSARKQSRGKSKHSHSAACIEQEAESMDRRRAGSRSPVASAAAPRSRSPHPGTA